MDIFSGREGKGRTNPKKENIFCRGEGKGEIYLENEKIYFCGGVEKRRGEWRGKNGEGKYNSGGRKGGKYLEKENIFFSEDKKNWAGKGGQ